MVACVLAVAAGSTQPEFEINTDINTLISPAIGAAGQSLTRHSIATTSCGGGCADPNSPALRPSPVAKLSGDTAFRSVQSLGSANSSIKNGLLFLPTKEVAELTGQFEQAPPD